MKRTSRYGYTAHVTPPSPASHTAVATARASRILMPFTRRHPQHPPLIALVFGEPSPEGLATLAGFCDRAHGCERDFGALVVNDDETGTHEMLLNVSMDLYAQVGAAGPVLAFVGDAAIHDGLSSADVAIGAFSVRPHPKPLGTRPIPLDSELARCAHDELPQCLAGRPTPGFDALRNGIQQNVLAPRHVSLPLGGDAMHLEEIGDGSFDDD
jgi:hypothetical protein